MTVTFPSPINWMQFPAKLLIWSSDNSKIYSPDCSKVFLTVSLSLTSSMLCRQTPQTPFPIHSITFVW